MGGTERDDRGTMAAPDYCPNCGTELADPGVFCSQCGMRCRDERPGSVDRRSERPDRSPSRDPVGESPEAFTRRIEEWLVEGWEVESDRGDSVVLVDRSLGSAAGHVVVFLLTVWFTGGLGNLAYAFYKHQVDQEKVLLRRGVGGTDPGTPGRRVRDSPSAGNLLLGVGLILLGVLFLASGPIAATDLLVAAFLFVAGGAFLPPLRRRLRERRPVSTTGRVRSTEERVLRDPNRACTVCAEPVEEGVERRYREEFFLAGIPLFTTEAGSNPYCRACATDEPSGVAGRPGDLDAELATLAGTDDADSGPDGDGSATEIDDVVTAPGDAAREPDVSSE